MDPAQTRAQQPKGENMNRTTRRTATEYHYAQSAPSLAEYRRRNAARDRRAERLLIVAGTLALLALTVAAFCRVAATDRPTRAQCIDERGTTEQFRECLNR